MTRERAMGISWQPDGSGHQRMDAAEAPSCMKWSSDGELSAVDLQGILQRLCAVDQQATSLMDCSLES